ncbi:MAG TPA: prenyltransferase/squalene oxidase repeat-containing protein [Prolixibacteraceae bacterium]|jgi:squalene-hopene/tetraprenyl-beta-curcumene cyclase|nr:hypothetical protein [Prolixibacteraceae bacterium]OQB81537.1 MAG: Sporulenol synthase [Bacteroidetes bacterium ADurb.Bin123]HOY92522.1 prenyltransferase/squalene oxidase repeat-containing protein [Prolixibacteraceae bacterium]
MNNTFLTRKYLDLSDKLKSEINAGGFWQGELSTSALATAVAIVALKTADNTDDLKRTEEGYKWLISNINPDGGYGDTTSSVSNVSTTLLCYAAVSMLQTNGNGTAVLRKMENWLAGKGITLDPKTITRSILKFYGKDYTFSIPILSLLIVCGVIPASSAKEIPGFPFELALLPSSIYRFVNLRVVSYALPALLAVGIYLHTIRGKKINPVSVVRTLSIKSAIGKLNSLVPESGGFLEAIPLTGFVVMCLIKSGEKENITVKKGIEFLRMQQRNDGGWPIDTDLSTWVTTLSVKALGSNINKVLNQDEIVKIRKHLITLQYKEKHPFNGAKLGGWGWTNFSGAVPDADDTPGAMLALLELYSGSEEENSALLNGCRWLIDLQNKDGGFPTFCKGWGRLPFDKSCADLTGHALLALLKTTEELAKIIPEDTGLKIKKSIIRAIGYLEKHQFPDGSWLPLWFGNQMTEEKTNPVYGTAKVCTYLVDCLKLSGTEKSVIDKLKVMIKQAQKYLLDNQNNDGSWGGKKNIAGTIEETSLAVCALAMKDKDSCFRGLSWLETHKNLKPSPIGLYFAMLWYDEKLYPLIYYTEALRRFLYDENSFQKLQIL